MAALFITGLATGAAMVLEFQKRRELTKKNRELEAALQEVTLENARLKHKG
jgi:Flp pilus assembly protein TadB